MKTVLFVVFVSTVSAALYDRHLSSIDTSYLIKEFEEGRWDRFKVDWEYFKAKYNKEYANEEEDKLRMKIYIENRFKIAHHNELYQKGVESYYVAMNQFGDWEDHEFKKLLVPYNATLDEAASQNASTFIGPDSSFLLPESVDWRTKGIVTAVKDQGRCNSCWAFASTGALEGQHARKTGRLVSLSEQNLVDCSTDYGNYGCKGGLIHTSYNYIKANKGIDTEESYPYEHRNGNCRYNKKFSGATVAGFSVLKNSETSLKTVVATMGPVAVGVDASKFKFYRGGVFYDKSCSEFNLNHAVLVVGYGIDKHGGDYWLMKNSWGPTWGDHGYIMLARNRGNQCGVVSYAVIPRV